MSQPYLMENDEEALRLVRKTDARVVEEFAKRAGLKPGMRVLDLCCGAGVTTSILAGLAGPGGSAVGVDASAARLDHARRTYGGPTVTFESRDVTRPLEGLGRFDFVWMRFALEYFRAEAPAIVGGLSSVLTPGGTVCLVDLDHNCLNHWGQSDRLDGALKAVLSRLETEGNFDPYTGRKLYSWLYRGGYRDIGVFAGAHHLIYGPLNEVDEYNWTRKIEVTARNRGLEIPGYASADEFLADFLAFFRDPARFTYTPVIAAWGRYPVPAST